MKLGDLEIDLNRRQIAVLGSEVHLTPTEWDLIKLFASHPDKVLTDRMITEAVWGEPTQRRHIRSTCMLPASARSWTQSMRARRHILTEPGVGYRFVMDGAVRRS
jgi:two-component system, OmpR family, KDP operon response regulator KdpE